MLELGIRRSGSSGLGDHQHACAAVQMDVLAGRGDHGTLRVVGRQRVEVETVHVNTPRLFDVS